VPDVEWMDGSIEVEGRRLERRLAAMVVPEVEVFWRFSRLASKSRVDGGRSFSFCRELRGDSAVDRAVDRAVEVDFMLSRRSWTFSSATPESRHLRVTAWYFVSLFSSSRSSSCSPEILAAALHHVEFDTHETLLSVLSRKVLVSFFRPGERC
jgi:hypothetical protein